MKDILLFLAGLMLGLGLFWVPEQFMWIKQPNVSSESTCRAKLGEGGVTESAANDINPTAATTAKPVDDSPTSQAPETTPSSNEWRWAPSGSCAAGTQARKNLLIAPSSLEIAAGEFAPSTLAQAAATFRACGVVAIAPPNPNAPAGEAHASLLNSVEASVARALAPVLASRKRVRSTLRDAMVNHGNLRSLWQRVKSEAVFASGHWCRERDDGRLDQKLPFGSPYNDSAIVGAGLGLSLIRALLGDRAELKSAHAVHALGRRSAAAPESLANKENDNASRAGGSSDHGSNSEVSNAPFDSNQDDDGIGGSDEAFATAREPQHWHRDTDLLWSSSSGDTPQKRQQQQQQQHFLETPAHDMHKGFFSPVYAINCFVPLRHLHSHDGPTEFTLGSHLWGDVWSDWELAEAPLYDHTFADSPRGTTIFADYRTVHRGTVNKSPRTRTLLMYIFGRDWWEDRTNYGLEDYGGSSTENQAAPFATRVFQRAARQQDEEEAQRELFARRRTSKSAVEDGEIKDIFPQSVLDALSTDASESTRERMYWALVSLWEEGIDMELSSRFVAATPMRR